MDGGFGAELDEQSTRHAYQGAAALQVRAAGFNLALRPREPFSLHGYGFLRFAVLPDSVTDPDPRLSVYINGDTRTVVPVFGPDAAALADADRRQWQVVEVPIGAFAWLEEPIETLNLMGRLSGTLYLDDIRWVAARPCPIEATWVSPPADTLVAGRPARLSAVLRATSAIDTAPLRVTADLSALRAGVVALTPGDGDQFLLAAKVGDGVPNGLYEISFRIEQEGRERRHVRQVSRPVCVVPAADCVLFGDVLEWEVSLLRRASLEVEATDGAFEGGAALAVDADYFTIEVAPPEPVSPAGYEYLHLAFKVGTATAVSKPPAFSVSVNDDSRTTVPLLADNGLGLGLDLGVRGLAGAGHPACRLRRFRRRSRVRAPPRRPAGSPARRDLRGEVGRAQ